MKVVIIVQARMTSTRLPGKVLKRVLDKPLLEYQMERLQRVKNADEIVVATTINAADDVIIELCKRLRIAYYRGSEQDVLSRYAEAAHEYDADVVVRITSDCPLIDPQVIEQVIQTYLDNSAEYDYVSNCLERTYPRGLDVEVFSGVILYETCEQSTTHLDREHVTSFIYQQPDRYQIINVKYVQNQSRHRWTVDTAEDFLLVRKIIESLYPQRPQFTLEDCLSLLEDNPGWQDINSNIQQKQLR